MWFKNNINYKLIDFLLRDEEYIYFENNNNNRSIKGIKHVHIFLKNN